MGQTPRPGLRRRVGRTAERARNLLGRYWLLLRLRRAGGTAVEVGSWRGDSAARALRWARPERLTLVDPWRHTEAPGYEHAMYANADQLEMDRIYEGVLQRFRDRIERGEVIVRREGSVQAAAGWSGGVLDWAYIDGDHTYEGVMADLEAWWPHIRPGGLLAGDDYARPGWWEDGVTRAVEDFARTHGCRAKAIGTQFVIEKPGPAAQP